MGKVIAFPVGGHARARSFGYRSGRNSCRETPDNRSISSTRNEGADCHLQTACIDIPSDFAILAGPPADSMALRRADDNRLIAEQLTMGLPQSQALVHCWREPAVYPIDMTLGDRIAKERKKRGLTQPDLAKLLGVSKQAVFQWEIGKKVPNIAHGQRLAEILKIPFELFLHATISQQTRPTRNEESA